jgi:hypothetical protein
MTSSGGQFFPWIQRHTRSKISVGLTGSDDGTYTASSVTSYPHAHRDATLGSSRKCLLQLRGTRSSDRRCVFCGEDYGASIIGRFKADVIKFDPLKRRTEQHIVIGVYDHVVARVSYQTHAYGFRTARGMHRPSMRNPTTRNPIGGAHRAYHDHPSCSKVNRRWGFATHGQTPTTGRNLKAKTSPVWMSKVYRDKCSAVSKDVLLNKRAVEIATYELCRRTHYDVAPSTAAWTDGLLTPP